MDQPKKIFVISWFYPPVNSSEGIVTYKLLKNSQNRYTVFTQKENTSWSYGNGEESLKEKKIHTIFSDAENFSNWIENAVSYFVSNQEDFDYIMSRSMPPESHIVGLKIKRLFPNIKWVASFGDPIANNPYSLLTSNVISPYSWNPEDVRLLNILRLFSPIRVAKNVLWKFRHLRKDRIKRKKEYDLQREIVKKADLLIFNSEQQRSYMLKGYPDEVLSKSEVLPHSFDNSLFPKSKNLTSQGEKIVMNYIGHADSLRTPKPLFEAIKQLQNIDKNLKDKIEINFYGNLGDGDKIFIIDNYLTEIIHYKGNVRYLESLKIMKNSQWLLHIDARLNLLLDENIFFAAKLADYIGSSSKIFGITMINGPSADLVRKYRGIVCSHSVQDILNYLYLIIYHGYTHKINEKCQKELESRKIAKSFDVIVNKLVEKDY